MYKYGILQISAIMAQTHNDEQYSSYKSNSVVLRSTNREVERLQQIEEKHHMDDSTKAMGEQKGSGDKKEQKSLSEIENRFDALDVDLVMAIVHRDAVGLANAYESIKNLMADLLEIPDGSEKAALEKEIRCILQEAEERKYEILDDKDSQDTNKEERIMTVLEDIESSLLTIDIPVNYVVDLKMIQTYKETLRNCEDQLKTVEEISKEIQNKKYTLNNEIKTLRMLIDKSEMMSKVQSDKDQEVSLKKNSTVSEIKDSLTFLKQKMQSHQSSDDINKEELVITDSLTWHQQEAESSLNLSQYLDNLMENFKRFHNSFDVGKLKNHYKAKQQLEVLSIYIQEELSQISKSQNTISVNSLKHSDQVINGMIDELYYDSIDQSELDQSKLQSFENEKQLTHEINKLSEKVSKFSGTFKNVLYTELEKDLKRCLSEIDSNIKDKGTATRLKSDVQKNLKILEAKSNKDKHYGQTVQNDFEERQTLHAIKTDFEKIKDEIISQNPTSKKELETLKRRLNLTCVALKYFRVKDAAVLEEKKRVLNEALEYLNNVTHQLSLVRNEGIFISQLHINIEDKETATPMKSNLQKNVKILKQVEQGNFKERKNLQAIKTDFKHTKAELNKQNPMSQIKLETLKNRLDSAHNNLQNFEAKDKLVIEDKKHLQDEVLKCLNYVKDQLALIEKQRIVKGKADIQNHEYPDISAIIEALNSVEESINQIRPKVENFYGKETSDKFVELDERLIQDVLRLEKLKLTRGDEFHTRKIKMLKEINRLNDMLDDRAKETKLIEEMDNNTREIMKKIEKLAINFNNGDIDNLFEELTNIRIKLMKPKLNSALESLSNSCLEDVLECFKQLKQADQNKHLEE